MLLVLGVKEGGSYLEEVEEARVNLRGGGNNSKERLQASLKLNLAVLSETSVWPATAESREANRKCALLLSAA